MNEWRVTTDFWVHSNKMDRDNVMSDLDVVIMISHQTLKHVGTGFLIATGEVVVYMIFNLLYLIVPGIRF